ncbi:MAG: ATP-binding protein [Cytophagales bacterium]
MLLLICFACFSQNTTSNTWQKVLKDKKGSITISWFESKPFIYTAQNGKIAGIEFEILECFRNYLKDEYSINLTINYEKSLNFGKVFTIVKDTNRVGIFGASALSITSKREQIVSFSNPYMSDIEVLITSKNLPIVKNSDEFNRLFSKLTAVTIKETTYESDILEIKQKRRLPFKIEYISSSDNVLDAISKHDSAFGFIDLPIYLMHFKKNPSVEIQRQNLFPIKRNGYAFMMAKNSDWVTPLNEFLASKCFKSSHEGIFDNYIDLEDYYFVENLSMYNGGDEDVVLLTKEKQIQNEYLLERNLQIVQERQSRNYLIAIASVVFVSLVVIFVLYNKLRKDHRVVSDQKKKIEIQAESIEVQNVQLENRNKRLNALNDEKNHLIKILAHDLRSPISHVEGISQLLLHQGTNLTEEQKKHLNLILNASMRLNKMIANILDIDAIENERVNIFLEKIDVVETTKNIIDSFASTANRKKIIIHFLPLETQSFIKADMLLYTEIIENLVSNAIKFSSESKSIFVAVKNDNDWISISVKDEGPGLSNEDKLLIFKKFQKLSARPTGGEQSTGLGLSIVKKYTELMYGRISFDSVLGEGTRFTVQFESIDQSVI